MVRPPSPRGFSWKKKGGGEGIDLAQIYPPRPSSLPRTQRSEHPVFRRLAVEKGMTRRHIATWVGGKELGLVWKASDPATVEGGWQSETHVV